MQESVYHIQMKTAMGVKQGKAEVRLQDGRVTLELLGGENLFRGEFTPGYSFETAGALKTAVRELPGILCGVLTGNQLHAVFRTEQGNFPIEGILENASETQR